MKRGTRPVAASPWLSQLLFVTDAHALAIAAAGGTVLIGSLNGARISLIQGVQRIGDIARINVWTLFINTTLTIAVYAILGERGIVPALLGTALVNLAVTSHYSKRVVLPHVDLNHAQTAATIRLSSSSVRLSVSIARWISSDRS